MKLISMTEFVIEQEKELSNILEEILPSIKLAKTLDKIINYANFLNQPLTLGMFVPCDEDGDVLQEPKFYYREEDLKHFKGQELQVANRVNEKCKQYQKAKDKVLFDGFDIYSNGDLYNSFVTFESSRLESMNVENLITDFQYSFYLTLNAIKQLGL